MIDAEQSGTEATELGYLVYELLDAHEDTMRLAGSLAGDERWAAHLDYLRDLQRVGRERLAWLGCSTESALVGPSRPRSRKSRLSRALRSARYRHPLG